MLITNDKNQYNNDIHDKDIMSICSEKHMTRKLGKKMLKGIIKMVLPSLHTNK